MMFHDEFVIRTVALIALATGSACAAGPAEGDIFRGTIDTAAGDMRGVFLVDDGRAVFGGDMVMPLERLRDPSPREVPDDDVVARTAALASEAAPGALWPNKTLFYDFEGTFTPTERETFLRTTRMMARELGLHFQQRRDVPDWVRVTRNATGCFSAVGRLGGVQDLNLGPRCWTTHVIAHELMHALGFIHEHQRPDRDEFVRVRWQNLWPWDRVAFEKVTTAQRRSPYDLRSIMHYDSHAFTINGQPTLVSLVPGVPVPDNNQDALFSARDIAGVARAYGP
jgi:hypothetical protein